MPGHETRIDNAVRQSASRCADHGVGHRQRGNHRRLVHARVHPPRGDAARAGEDAVVNVAADRETLCDTPKVAVVIDMRVGDEDRGETLLKIWSPRKESIEIG